MMTRRFLEQFHRLEPQGHYRNKGEGNILKFEGSVNPLSFMTKTHGDAEIPFPAAPSDDNPAQSQSRTFRLSLLPYAPEPS